MKLWLYRSYAGWYGLVRHRPSRVKVDFTNHDDLFEQPGEPISIRNLCAEWVHSVLKMELRPLESILVEMDVKVVM
jgi:hypothetical protein